MKKSLFIALAFSLISTLVSAQVRSPAQALRLAQSTYEQGRLHELPNLLKTFLDKSADNGGFNKQQRIEAYRYLTLAHIYLEEPAGADSTMLDLLKADHYYQPNDLVEPAEFMGLYKTFRTTPVFSVGAKFGVNGIFPVLGDNYYVGNAAPTKGKYGTNVAFQFGVVFEKQMFTRSKKKFLQRLTFAPEVFYTLRNLTYNNPTVFTSDSLGTSAATLTGDLKQTWLEFHTIFQYQVKNTSLNPYVGFGPGISYLLNAPSTMVLTRDFSIGTVSGPAVEFQPAYRKLVPSLTAVAGIKYQFGSIKLNAEARVQYSVVNVIDGSSRSVNEAVLDYNFVMSDIKQLTAGINLGFVYPYFNPIKKKIKK